MDLLLFKSETRTVGYIVPPWLLERVCSIDKIKKDVISLVEERINYACGVSLPEAMKDAYEPDDPVLNVFSRAHDIQVSAVALSADIAKVLYPFVCIKQINASDRVAFWREHVRWEDVPYPILCFLRTTFGDTNWRYVFMREHGRSDWYQNWKSTLTLPQPVKDAYRSKVIAIPRRTVQEAQGAINAESDEAAPDVLVDDFFLLTEDSECHYRIAFHDGRLVRPVFAVRMKGKTPPKWRKVCRDCCQRMDEDSLLSSIREMVSDPEMLRDIKDVPVGSMKQHRITNTRSGSSSDAPIQTADGGAEANVPVDNWALRHTLERELGDYLYITDDSECYYKRSFHGGRTVRPAFAIRMKGRTPPMWRRLCNECCHRMNSCSLLEQFYDMIPGISTSDMEDGFDSEQEGGSVISVDLSSSETPN